MESLREPPRRPGEIVRRRLATAGIGYRGKGYGVTVIWNSRKKDEIMKTDPVDSIQVAHQAIEIDVAYDRFTQNLEKILGRFDPAVTATLATDPRQADEDMKMMEGEQSLMIFGSQDHGTLFLLIGERRKAKRYTLGNPRVAIKMTSHDIRAGLYVPLTVLVY
jgi:hypothetical protein